MWLATAMIGIFFLNIVLFLLIHWNWEAFNNAPEAIVLITSFIILGILTLPLFLALMFNVRSTWTLRQLSDEKRRMYKEKKRMYVEWFMKAILEGNYQKAKDIHNDLICGDTKTLTRGIMVGLLHMAGDSEDKAIALKHMSQIPDEVYDLSKEK